MELSDAEKTTLARDGFVKLPGIVPGDKVTSALRAINGSLGSSGIDPEKLQTFRARSYCPEVQTTPAILDLLYETPLRSLVESAIGPDSLDPVSSGQIALRFPQAGDARDPHPHIDGMYTPDNGVPKGTIASFTGLIGVFLSDVDETYSGNFTVWPGTHRTYEEYFRSAGPEALLNGMPDVDLPQPVQVTAKAGDAVFCHYQLGHGIAGNASPNIRYAIFFRLFKRDHDQIRLECLTDIWREWEGMSHVLDHV